MLSPSLLPFSSFASPNGAIWHKLANKPRLASLPKESVSRVTKQGDQIKLLHSSKTLSNPLYLVKVSLWLLDTPDPKITNVCIGEMALNTECTRLASFDSVCCHRSMSAYFISKQSDRRQAERLFFATPSGVTKFDGGDGSNFLLHMLTVGHLPAASERSCMMCTSIVRAGPSSASNDRLCGVSIDTPTHTQQARSKLFSDTPSQKRGESTFAAARVQPTKQRARETTPRTVSFKDDPTRSSFTPSNSNEKAALRIARAP